MALHRPQTERIMDVADFMSEAEALSLQAAGVVDEGAVALMRERPGLDYSSACRMFTAANPHVAAAYAGDQAAFTELSARARVTRMAAGPQERHFKRAGPPRAISRRAIQSKAELLPGEVLCAHLTAAPGEPTLYAEVLA